MNFSGISDRTILGKCLRLPFRLIPSGTTVRILQGPLRGRKWIAGSGNHGCWLGSYEYAMQRAFSKAVKPEYSVYDLGANVGFYSLLASVLVGPRGRVFSFEPAPRNTKFLRRHLELNGVTNCTVWEVAVARCEGTSTFDLAEGPSQGRLSAEKDHSISVRTVSLDEFVCSGEIAPPDLIKCDIEGGEYEALLGAANTLAKYRPTIFLATHGHEVHQQCCGLLLGLNYQLITLTGCSLDQASEVLAIHH